MQSIAVGAVWFACMTNYFCKWVKPLIKYGTLLNGCPSKNKRRYCERTVRELTLEYSVMACMRASVACERKVLELSVARDAARLMRESWDRSSACHRVTTCKQNKWPAKTKDENRMQDQFWVSVLACLKGIAQRPPPKVTDARLEYRMCFHFPGLRATRCLLLPKMTVADLL